MELTKVLHSKKLMNCDSLRKSGCCSFVTSSSSGVNPGRIAEKSSYLLESESLQERKGPACG